MLDSKLCSHFNFSMLHTKCLSDHQPASESEIPSASVLQHSGAQVVGSDWGQIMLPPQNKALGFICDQTDTTPSFSAGKRTNASLKTPLSSFLILRHECNTMIAFEGRLPESPTAWFIYMISYVSPFSVTTDFSPHFRAFECSQSEQLETLLPSWLDSTSYTLVCFKHTKPLTLLHYRRLIFSDIHNFTPIESAKRKLKTETDWTLVPLISFWFGQKSLLWWTELRGPDA